MEEGVIYHDEENQKFFIEINDHQGHLKYDKDGDVLDFHHTFVPESFRGQGIAGKIVESALEFAKENNYKVKPSCPFVASYIKRHEKYMDIVQ